jgi:hypothetical protein
MLSTGNLPNTLIIGNGYIRPPHAFTIKFISGKLDRSSIQMKEETEDSMAYRNALVNSTMIWSLDKFFKSGDSNSRDGELLNLDLW